MKAQLPTEETLREEIRATIAENPHFRQCINCCHFSGVTNICDISNRKIYPYVPACSHYETAEERLLRKTIEDLTAQARECEKIEFLLAMSLTAANMTSLFIEDFERRVKTVYQREKKSKDKAGRSKNNLRKDLDLATQMDNALGKIDHHLGEIEKQYRHYIQSHVDKIFKKHGVYNDKAHDQFHADAGEFARFLLELARVAHYNRDNADELYDRMKEMLNRNPTEEDNTFCLDDKDINHYILKE